MPTRSGDDDKSRLSPSQVEGPYSLVGQVALVTGAASGIGRATAEVLARQGADIVLLDVDNAGLKSAARVVNEYGGRSAEVVVDLTDPIATRRAAAAAVSHFERIDVLVCSAGIMNGTHSILEVGDETIRTTFAINVHSTFALTSAIGKHMIQAGTAGRIVYLSSSSAFRARMSAAHYSTSKAAIAQLARSAAAELGPYGIRVNAVAPGPTRTPMNDFSDEEFRKVVSEGPVANLLGLVAEASDVAEVICFLCVDASRTITGQVVHASSGAVV